MINPDVSSKKELLEELYHKLQLPNYFGYSWDALLDCLTDLHWINDKKIILIHAVIPHIDKNDLESYLEVLNEAAEDWKKDEEHSLEIIFPKSSQYALKLLMDL